MIKKIFIGILAIFLIIQIFQPDRTNSSENTADIRTAFEVPSEVEEILKVACNDCHSNNTRYPWYSYVQPVGWWLADHVDHGKEHLNFSEFTNLRLALQKHKFEEIAEEVSENKMPLPSYTNFGMHPEANLSESEKEILISWAKNAMVAMDEKYPADSLILRRR